MTWPEVDQSVRGIDISNYQRHPHTGDIPDPVTVHNADYGIKFVCLRAALWDDPDPDWSFYENWDAWEAAGYDMMVYHVVRTDRDVDAQIDNLEAILDGRQPRVIWDDAERRDGSSSIQSRQVHQWYLERATDRFGHFADVLVYTAPWYWSAVLGYTEWAREWGLIVAGYPYETAGQQFTKYDAFEEVYLPNTWTNRPELPLGWKGKREATGWQFSDKGVIEGITDTGLNPARPRVDLVQIRAEQYNQWYGSHDGNGGGDDPPPVIPDVSGEIQQIRDATNSIEAKMTGEES